MIPGPKGLGCTSPGGLWEVGSQGTGEQGRATERAVTPGRLLHSAKTGALIPRPMFPVPINMHGALKRGLHQSLTPALQSSPVQAPSSYLS